MSGTLGLSSPWCRQEIPTAEERRAIEARIPDGYTIGVMCKADHSAFGVYVMEWGATMRGNGVIRDRLYYRSGQALRDGIDAAIDWIADHDTATYAGVAVPVR